MSRTTAHLRRLIGFCLLAAAFALTEAIAIPAASAGPGKKLDPPTLLWKSYPLERRPSTTGRAEVQIRRRQASRQTSAHQDDFLTPVLVSAFILLLASAAIVRMRRSMPIRVGNARRTPDRAPMPRSAQPASVNRPRWRPRRPQQLREVSPEVVREPHARAAQSPAPESDADLLEALQPKPPSLPEPEPTPEVAVVDLEQARPGRMPAPVEQRPATQLKPRETGDPLVEEREAEAGPSRESQLGLKLRTRIADVHVVPVPEPSPQTHEESRAARQQGRLQRAGGEVCEIRLWRGYVKCQLFAAPLTGSEAAIAVSSYFRLRDEDSPGDEARLALRDLIATLEQGGWTVVSRGPTWYEDRLERFAEDPGEDPDEDGAA
jgi:hypothetical protein